MPSKSTPAFRAFYVQRQNAKQRGIEWRLTFDEWNRVWQDSGRWDSRGRGAGQYVMSRHGDKGAYEAGNVFINLGSQNVSDGVTGIKRSVEQNALRSKWMRGNKNSVGRRWMHKDGLVRCIPSVDIGESVSAGWMFGRKA